ncbi:hypothetical protein BGZ54_000138 [Gamsiella multidivaricata]|nr:hypothetical protein BGZ54_000138 [Gamsiella multidivaricata]
MTTNPRQKRHYESLSTQATTTSKKQKTNLVFLSAKDDKKYTKRELEAIERGRRRSYNDLLDCARRKDMSVLMMFPDADGFEIPTARVSYTLEQQVELLDIYHYLYDRKEDLRIKLSHSSFGPKIGVYLPKHSLEGMLKREDKIRAAAKTYPTGAHYIVDRKNRKSAMIEDVLYRWLQDQRKQNVPVSDKMVKKACTILVDLQDNSGDTVSEAPPSFSVAWFDDMADKTMSKASPSFSASSSNAIKRRYRITYCQLHREVESVDPEVIEPELAHIRQLCA